MGFANHREETAGFGAIGIAMLDAGIMPAAMRLERAAQRVLKVQPPAQRVAALGAILKDDYAALWELTKSCFAEKAQEYLNSRADEAGEGEGQGVRAAEAIIILPSPKKIRRGGWTSGPCRGRRTGQKPVARSSRSFAAIPRPWPRRRGEICAAACSDHQRAGGGGCLAGRAGGCGGGDSRVVPDWGRDAG